MTDPLAPRMRWWGWGVDGHDAPLPRTAAALLRAELGVGGARAEPVALEQVELQDPALDPAHRAQLTAAAGGKTEHVRDDRLTRITHAAGRSYPDLLRLRTGAGLDGARRRRLPRRPRRGRGGARRLRRARDRRRARSVAARASSAASRQSRGPFHAAISLDLARLSGLQHLDAPSQLATFGAGTLGPEVERLLEEHGLTLGHFPQSFEFSTVGGWAATRSAGQASTGYGRIDELVVALRAATPSGELATLPVPASAAGPDLRELLLGSEGALGVITEVTLRVRPRPQQQRYDTYALPGFAAGTEALRELEQTGAAPDVARLSDEEETRISLALASHPAATRLLRSYMNARARHGRARTRANHRNDRPAGCMTILGFDGDPGQVALRRARARKILRRHGAVALGPAPGAAWAKGRFHGAYLRDELMARGVFVETLETATTWSALTQTHRAIRDALHRALAERGTPAVVMCHVSHLYPTGASLYFTFLARRQPGAELAQWHAAKQAASAAISDAGATITHHHAVGRDHAPWLQAEVGALGIAALQAVKARVDPAGIMNPGKLLP